MYGYMVLVIKERLFLYDFMSYYKRNKHDETYYVCIDNPKLLPYLEAFLERRKN